MRYVAEFGGEWLTLGAWSVAQGISKVGKCSAGMMSSEAGGWGLLWISRNPNAALVLEMFRRVVVSFVIPWSQKQKKTNKSTSTRDFLEHNNNAKNYRRAFDLVTSKTPSAWKILKISPSALQIL